MCSRMPFISFLVLTFLGFAVDGNPHGLELSIPGGPSFDLPGSPQLPTSLSALPSLGLPVLPLPREFHVPTIAPIPTPSINVPSIHIPPINIQQINIDGVLNQFDGYKTDKWQVRENLERDGWWVAYGHEIAYPEYSGMCGAIAASVATGEPAPALAYLDFLIDESVDELETNAEQKFGEELQNLAKKVLIDALDDAIEHGQIQTIKLQDIEVQIGIATYTHSEFGNATPNTFQPYIRAKLIIGSTASNTSHVAVARWVFQLENSTPEDVTVTVVAGGSPTIILSKHKTSKTVYRDSAVNPNFHVVFSPGPGLPHKDYALIANAFPTTSEPSKGQHYTFRLPANGSVDLYKGGSNEFELPGGPFFLRNVATGKYLD